MATNSLIMSGCTVKFIYFIHSVIIIKYLHTEYSQKKQNIDWKVMVSLLTMTVSASASVCKMIMTDPSQRYTIQGM